MTAISRDPLCWIPFVFLATLFAPHAFALDRGDLPTGFGMQFYAVDIARPRVLPPLQSAPEAEDWERRIQERVWEHGPYGSDISETLLDAASYLFGRGDYRGAITYWRRAVHLIRVNNGLNSELQLPTLERLLDTYLAIGDRESADEIHAYLFHLSGKHYEPGEPEYIDATVEWVDWQREQWMRAPDSENPEQLMSVWRLLDRQTREEEEAPLTVDQLEPLVYAQLRTLYLIGVSDFGLDREAEMMLGRQYGRASQDPNVDRTQLQALRDGAYTRGRKRLEDLDARLAERGLPARRAEAQKALGDWHLWYGYPSRAADSYRESWHLLVEAGLPERHTEWFGEPQELPVGGILWAGRDETRDPARAAVVTARFDVSERGRVKRVKTESRDPDRSGKAIRLSRLLRDTRFRPRMEAGEPVATSQVVRDYLLP